MLSKTNEQAFEAIIEKALTGTCIEELKDSGANTLEGHINYGGNGYLIGDYRDFDAHFAIDKVLFWEFLNESQEDALESLKKASDWKERILDRFHKKVKKYGVLSVLKEGLEIQDTTLHFMYPLPTGGSGETSQRLFGFNKFSVTRQVHYNINKPNESIDMVVFINGIPVITMELKNPWTGQSAKIDGQRQYKKDRDTSQTLLNFGRCLVHFAVDKDQVFMTTKLNGDKTFFLPFNKSYVNPINPSGHKTAYLWEDILQKETLCLLIQDFIRFDGKKTDKLETKTLYFPRFHQLDVVRKLKEEVTNKGVGETYLIQHSAGSGKSNSITWLAFQLIAAYPNNKEAAKDRSLDQPLFDSVIVVTDRTILDKQLRENIQGYTQQKGIVAAAYSSRDLRNSLDQGKRIIITTIQKFPHIMGGMADMRERNFGIIIDEAHSSQSGEAAAKMNEVLGLHNESGDIDELDIQEVILRAVEAKKMRSNASYFAFTATPKNSTLERFGIKHEDGSYRAFHDYTMKQAIQEGFILDVVANYTTHKSYYEILKKIEDNPEFDTLKAQRRIKAFVESEDAPIRVKADEMMNHFMASIYNKKLLKGKAKAMVVTQDIPSAITYFKAIQDYLKAKGNPFRVAIAFSGKKLYKGQEYDELQLNNFPPELDTKKSSEPDYINDKIARYFDMDEYRILVVANKYLTGFDQPKLCAMYVDKKLSGVLAVQALSRLNRSAPKFGKKVEDLFVLDYFNSVDDIKKAFDPYYTSTVLTKGTDLSILDELREELGNYEVYFWEEVERYNEAFFSGADQDRLSPMINQAIERFDSLEDEEKVDFKIKAKQFVGVYSKISAIIEATSMKWEMLYWFLKFLIKDLHVKTKQDEDLDDILSSVDLATYGLQRTRTGAAIVLDDAEGELDPASTGTRSSHGGGDKTEIDLIVKEFNDRWFKEWDAAPEDKKLRLVSILNHLKNHKDIESKYFNNSDPENKDLALKKIIVDVLGELRKKEVDFYRLHATEESFQHSFFHMMKTMLERR